MRRAFVLLVATIGCGARSQLDGSADGNRSASASAQQGASFASAVGSGGSGGSVTSGGGGGALVCNSLVVDGPLEPVATLPFGSADYPKLHPIEAGRVAVVHRASVAGALKIASTTLNWTASWPPVALPPIVLHAPAGVSYAADRREAQSIALLLGATNGAGGMSFGFADASVGGFTPIVGIDPLADRAAFVVSRGDRYLFGMQAPGAYQRKPSYQLVLGAVHWPSNVRGATTVDAACGDEPYGSAAIPTSGGWLLAHATPYLEPGDRAHRSCHADVAPLPAARVQVVRHGVDLAEGMSFGANLPFSSSRGQVSLTTRSGGGWLIYDRPLHAVALDEQGAVAFDAGTITDEASGYGFAVDRLDDGIAVGFVVANEPADFRLVVTDAVGKPIASATLVGQAPEATLPELLFDAKTRRLLVAMTRFDDTGAPKVHVARLSCS